MAATTSSLCADERAARRIHGYESLEKLIKVAAFTGGKHVPGARFRVRQFQSALLDQGIELTEFPAPLGAYPPVQKIVRPLWAVGSLATRLPGVVASFRHDVTLLQREMLSTFATLERFTSRPRILDVDDAIWLYRQGNFIRKIAAACDSVICGNNYIAEYFARWNSRITVIPTAVDTQRFAPCARRSSEKVIIGWSGTWHGFVDLKPVLPALAEVLRRNPTVVFRVFSDKPPAFPQLPASQVEFVSWSPEAEAAAIQGMDIGIMPLEDSRWNRGKCSYKMLLYMACGLPVVVSPVGMNAEVLALGEIGRGAAATDQWVSALEELATSPRKREVQGRCAREVADKHFSIQTLGPKFADEIKRVMGISY